MQKSDHEKSCLKDKKETAPEYYSESSRTDSSESKHSEITQPDDEEHHMKSHREVSPIDMECNIQRERITKSLDNMVYQVKVALSVPTLLRDPSLPLILTESQLSDIRFICEQYDNPLHSASLGNVTAMDDVKAGDMTLKHRSNPELSFMLYTLSICPKIKPRVLLIVAKMMQTFIKDGVVDINAPVGLLYLLKIQHFRNLFVAQMTDTAAEQLAVKILIRKLEESNPRELAKIAEYSECLKDEKIEFEKNMAMKSEEIAQLQQDLNLRNHIARVKREQKILYSERMMVVETRKHLVTSKMLAIEELESREYYQGILSNDVKVEKNLRLRRGKVETQLQSWLQKYDVEMTCKQNDLEEIIQMYEEESKLKEELEIKLVEQDKVYIPLMEERDKEYHEELQQKYLMLLVEHAARVIQTAWRETKYNRAEKKKLKRLLAKQIAEREIAERKAEILARKAAKEAKRLLALKKKAEKKAAIEAKLAAKAAKAKESK